MDRSRTTWWLRRETIGTVIGVGLWLLINAAMAAMFQLQFFEHDIISNSLISSRPISRILLLFSGFVQSAAFYQPMCNLAFCCVLFVSGGRRTRCIAAILLMLSTALFFSNPWTRRCFLEFGLICGWRMLLLLLVTSLGTAKVICSIFRIQLHPQQKSAAQISLWQLLLGMTLLAISFSDFGLTNAPLHRGGLSITLIYRVAPTIAITAIACTAAVTFLPRRKPFKLGKRPIRSGEGRWVPYVAFILLVAAVQYPLSLSNLAWVGETFWANAQVFSLSLAAGGCFYHGLLLSTAFTFAWFLGLRRSEAVVSKVH